MLVRSIAFPPRVWKQIQLKAQSRGLSAAAFIRMLVIEKLAKEEEQSD
jgi:hypothetical protein